MPIRREVTVRLNPQDFPACKAARPAEGEGSSANADVVFVADPSVPRAGAIVESPQGVIESTIEGHLAAVGEALHKDS
jgi:flagellar biosynthesis/type III secretory pathway protein FliH